jgi:TonB-linked SusC/RagA family outer membrane protein
MNMNQRRFNRNWGTNNRINNPNSINVGDGNVLNWSWSNVFSYNTTLSSGHNLSFMMGSEAIKGTGYDHLTTERDFPDQDINLVYLGNGLGMITTSENQWGYSLISFFGRANYNYNNKYLVSATVRQDGSSRFSPGKRWGTFYSFSAGWRIDREAFFENVSSIHLLKLRAGYGSIGNQDVGYYAYSDQISPDYNYPFGGISADGYAISVLGNEDVQWETSNQLDIGLDLGLFEGKLNLTVDYYHKITSDMLIKEPIPSSAGYADAAWVNKGKILNRGIEFDLNYRKIFKDWRISLTANLATVHNEVLELTGTVSGGRIDNGVYATLTEKGKPVGSFYLYEMEGIFQNEIDIITHAYQGENIDPGDVKFKDQNADGIIDEKDRTHVGSAIPDITCGFNASVNYKAFDLSLFLQGAFGNDIYYQVATDIEGFYRPFNLTERYYDERWRGEGTSNTQPLASWSSKANNTKPSTRFLEDGSYMRLKNLQIGYTLPESATAKLHLSGLRIYAAGHNLFTLSKYAGLDAEMTVSDNSTAEGDRAAGIDWGTYPSALSYSMGIQLTF